MVLDEKKVQRVGYNLASRGLIGVLGTGLVALVGGCGDCDSNYQNPQSNLPTPMAQETPSLAQETPSMAQETPSMAQETPSNSLEKTTQRYFNSTPEVLGLKRYLTETNKSNKSNGKIILQIKALRYRIRHGDQLAVVVAEIRNRKGELSEVIYELKEIEHLGGWMVLSGITVGRGRIEVTSALLADTTPSPTKK